MVLDEDDDEAEMHLFEGDSIDECEEIEEDNASDRQIQPEFPHNGKSTIALYRLQLPWF